MSILVCNLMLKLFCLDKMLQQFHPLCRISLPLSLNRTSMKEPEAEGNGRSIDVGFFQKEEICVFIIHDNLNPTPRFVYFLPVIFVNCIQSPYAFLLFTGVSILGVTNENCDDPVGLQHFSDQFPRSSVFRLLFYMFRDVTKQFQNKSCYIDILLP